jgi:hypothetical protein
MRFKIVSDYTNVREIKGIIKMNKTIEEQVLDIIKEQNARPIEEKMQEQRKIHKDLTGRDLTLEEELRFLEIFSKQK